MARPSLPLLSAREVGELPHELLEVQLGDLGVELRAAKSPSAIVAVLLSMVLLLSLAFVFFVPRAFRDHFATRCSKVKMDIIAISAAVEQYAIENNGSYPESLRALVIPDEHGFSYMDQERVPVDRWGVEYGYEAP